MTAGNGMERHRSGVLEQPGQRRLRVDPGGGGAARRRVLLLERAVARDRRGEQPRIRGRAISPSSRDTSFGPLGIRTATWDPDLSGRHWGGTGLRIRPRDIGEDRPARPPGGSLWKGRRLVSREWIAESTRGQTAGIAGAPNYGYQWWIRPRGRYLAHGYNGQYIGVDPEADVVMTMITLSERSPRPQETFRSYFEELQDLARAAIRPERLRAVDRHLPQPSSDGNGPRTIAIEVRR